MYDLHTHILPGVDDGPRTYEEAIEMGRIAAVNGTRAMLTTPHRKDITENWSIQFIRELLLEVNRTLRGDGIDIILLPGMENHLDLALPQDISAGKALSMNDTDYILVEMPFWGRPDYLEDVMSQIQTLGLIPVLAHPERIEAFQKDHELLAGFINDGMVSQITAGSLLGHFGRKPQKFAEDLLRENMVHIIASDTHFPYGHRCPLLTPGMQAAAKIIGPVRALAMVDDTPKAILDGLSLNLERPV